MKTQKELKEEIQFLGDELRKLRKSPYKDKIYLKHKEKADERIEKLLEEQEPKENEIYGKLAELRKELEKRRLSKKIQLSKYLEDWLYQYMSGIDWGYKKPFIAWHSEDERFVILTHPGQTVGQGTAMGAGGYHYSSSDHHLIDTKVDARGIRNTQHIKLGYKIGSYVEGRLTKEKKQILLDRLEEYKKENKIK